MHSQAQSLDHALPGLRRSWTAVSQTFDLTGQRVAAKNRKEFFNITGKIIAFEGNKSGVLVSLFGGKIPFHSRSVGREGTTEELGEDGQKKGCYCCVLCLLTMGPADRELAR